MSRLEWTDAFVLGPTRMDDTHREFVDLVGALEGSIDARPEATDSALEHLLAHTVEHFAQEERWMAALGFEPDNCHTFQHAHVLQVMREVTRLHREEGDLALVRQLVGELAKWFPVHAQTMDSALAEMMTARGFDAGTGRIAPPPASAASITGCGSA
jgi:hemerythrin